MTSSFHVNRAQSHLKWSKAQPPCLTVDSGQVVTFDAVDGGNGQITTESTAADVLKFDVNLADPVFGPVFVRDAEPGDALKVEILELKTGEWGWTAIVPGFGLLADEFKEPQLKIWQISDNEPFVHFKPGIRLLKRPFLGIMGVAPGVDGEFSTIPPLDTGGNIDCRHLVVGTTLYLPVRTAGALFSCGDGHAAQGDGEVCGSAIETSMRATLRISVEKGNKGVQSPHYYRPPGLTDTIPSLPDRGSYSVLGIDGDLHEATRKAIRGILDYLQSTRGLSRVEAYMLASTAVDLKMVEVVDFNFAIAACLPLNIFED